MEKPLENLGCFFVKVQWIPVTY